MDLTGQPRLRFNTRLEKFSGGSFDRIIILLMAFFVDESNEKRSVMQPTVVYLPIFIVFQKENLEFLFECLIILFYCFLFIFQFLFKIIEFIKL